MKFEVVENSGEWIVRREGEEVGRFPEQDLALSHVADRLREVGDGGASLAMRYQAKRA